MRCTSMTPILAPAVCAEAAGTRAAASATAAMVRVAKLRFIVRLLGKRGYVSKTGSDAELEILELVRRQRIEVLGIDETQRRAEYRHQDAHLDARRIADPAALVAQRVAGRLATLRAVD